MTEVKNLIPEGLRTDDTKAMKKFISSTESGLYHGTAEDGLGIAMNVEKGEGATLYIQQLTKPKWNNVIYFGKDGMREGDGVKLAIV